MTSTRRRLLETAATLAALPMSSWAQSGKTYPDHLMKLVVPYPPGGGNDVLARAVKSRWEKAWGQAVIVENRPGANGSLGAELVAKSPGDGYTLLMGSVATHAITPALRKGALRYDARRDFVPVALIGSTPLILTVNPSVPVNNVKEFIALAKREPGRVTYASVGAGSAGHLAGALFEQMAGVDLLHVAYKGISQASTELVGGVVQAAFSNVLNVLPLIRTGKLRALGVTGNAPLDVLPGVPPIGQTLPGYTVDLWWGLFAPAGTPIDIARKLHAETNAYLSAADARERWAQEGITLSAVSREDFIAQMDRDAKKWADVIAARKIVEE